MLAVGKVASITFECPGCFCFRQEGLKIRRSAFAAEVLVVDQRFD